MEKSPAARFATARAMEEDLHRYIKDLPIVVRRPSYAVRTLKYIRRHRALSLAFGLAAAITVSIVFFVQWRESRRELLQENIRSLTKKGVDLTDSSEWLDAERQFHMILKLDESNVDALTNLGRMRLIQYNKSGRTPELSHLLTDAEQYVRRALETSPKHHNALNLLGVLCKKLGKYEQALEAYDTILKNNRTSYSALVNKGTVLALQRELDEAYECLLLQRRIGSSGAVS